MTDTFGFHPLAVEDALVETHLPKIDDWDEYVYLVLYGVDFDQAKLEVDSHEVDVFLGPNYLVTHHTEQVNAIERLRSICQRDARRLQRGADYLLFEMADAIVADFMPCLDALDETANESGRRGLQQSRPRKPCRASSRSSARPSICGASCRRSAKC